MSGWGSLRAGLIAALSAVAAVFAHAGPAGLADIRWLAAGGAGAVLASVAIAGAGGRVLRARARVRRVQAGDAAAGRPLPADRTSFPLLLFAMLACQGAAHLGLLAFGLHATGGPAGSLTLHALLAVGAAAMVAGLEHLAARAGQSLELAISRFLESLAPASALPVPVARPAPRICPVPREVLGRAPPVRS
ncbi:MAG TPA: hypothetical protein VFQ71_13180 [Gaiellales bacterium]|nr:hypothetical protein [Gaiellales bacterium]